MGHYPKFVIGLDSTREAMDGVGLKVNYLRILQDDNVVGGCFDAYVLGWALASPLRFIVVDVFNWVSFTNLFGVIFRTIIYNYNLKIRITLCKDCV
jgi:hypothetical protein